jgi:hypothetical protein
MPDWTSVATAVATSFGALVAIVGAALVVWQVDQARRNTQDEYEKRRRQAAIDFYAQTISQRDQWNLRLPPDRDAEAISDLLAQATAPGDRETEEIRRAIHNYLGFWELLSAGVHEEVLDRKTVVSLARGRAVAVWANYRSYIIKERERYHAPALYSELEKLATSLTAMEPARLTDGITVSPGAERG